MRRTVIVGLVVISLPLLAHAAADERVVAAPERTVSADLGTARIVEIDLPVGELQIEGVPGSELSAEMIITCEVDALDCAHRAERTLLQLTPGEERLRLTSSRTHSMGFRGMNVVTRVKVPSDVELDVLFSYGDLDIHGLDGCVRVAMKAGDVEIRLPHDAVRSAHLRAGVGDASLRLPDAYVEGRRVRLVGADVDWDQGPGTCEVDVDLTAGDILLALD